MQNRKEVNAAARQVLCPAYSACLNQSIESGSTGFDCRVCERPERHKIDPISQDEVLRAGRLLGEILFRGDRETVIVAVCPRCGKTHKCISCPGGSLRRFCQPCKTFEGSTHFGVADDGVALHSAHPLAVVPLEDEPGTDGDE